VVGNFGGSRFFDYTAYDGTINTVARLESANKFFGNLRQCYGRWARPAVSGQARGRSDPVWTQPRAYEPLPAGAFKAPAMTQYSQAFAKVESGRRLGDAGIRRACRGARRRSARGLPSRLLNGAKGVGMPLE